MPEPAHDALQALRERLEETREHSERLAAEAAPAAGPVPPTGDGAGPDGEPGPDGARARTTDEDVRAILALLEVLRDLVPPELQQQLAEVTRQVLLLLRALIDWWVERLEPAGDAAPSPGRAAAAPEVQDIPVS